MPTAQNGAPTQGDGEACARPLAERQIEALEELVGIGLKIARAIERRVDETGDGPKPLVDLNTAAIAYARVARAVRQSILLQDRLQHGEAPKAVKAEGLRARFDRVIRRVIEAAHDDPERVERLAAEAAERLEQEFQGDALSRPATEIIADVCKALGLKPDWRGLIDDIVALEAFAEEDDDSASGETDRIEPYWLDSEGRPRPAGRKRDTS